MTHLIIQNIFYGILLFLSILNYAVLFYCVLSWFVMPFNRLFQHGLAKTYRMDDPGRRILGGLLRGLQSAMNWIFSFLRRLIEPLVAPFRRLTDIMFGGRMFIDFSVLFLYFAIRIVERLVLALYVASLTGGY